MGLQARLLVKVHDGLVVRVREEDLLDRGRLTTEVRQEHAKHGHGSRDSQSRKPGLPVT